MGHHRGGAGSSSQKAVWLVLQKDLFSIQIGGTSLAFRGSTQAVQWSSPDNENVSIATSNVTTSPVDLGLIPLSLGGEWRFSSAGNGCAVTVSSETFGATCAGVEGLLPPSLQPQWQSDGAKDGRLLLALRRPRRRLAGIDRFRSFVRGEHSRKRRLHRLRRGPHRRQRSGNLLQRGGRRKARVRALHLLAGFSSAAAFALLGAACSGCEAPATSRAADAGAWTSQGPVLIVAQTADLASANEKLLRAGSPVEPKSSERARTAALALGALTPEAMATLEWVLDEVVTRLSVQTNPFVEDLDDDAPDAIVAALLRAAGPSLTACNAIASRRHSSGDGRLIASVAMSCPAQLEPGMSCVSLWGSDAVGPEGNRARFFAWSLASAGVLSVRSGETRMQAVQALRHASQNGPSTIALVLTEDDLQGRPDETGAAIRERAKRALELAHRASVVDTTLLELLASDPPTSRVVPWLQLAGDEVLVVPKLSAATRPSALANEVENELASQHLTGAWKRRPTRS